jgi:hypothetical protein
VKRIVSSCLVGSTTTLRLRMKRQLLCVGAMACLLFAVPCAQAGPLSGLNIEIFDDGVGVVAASVGSGGPGGYILTTTGVSTDFSFTVLISTSNQPGNPAGATIEVDQTSVTQITGGKHTFEVIFSDKSFASPSSTGVLRSSASANWGFSTTLDTVNYTGAASNTNVLFAQTVNTPLQLATSTGVNPNSAALTPNPSTIPFTAVAPYSMTNDTLITMNEIGGNVSTTGKTQFDTPEPTSITMLCLGLAGMCGYGWRRRKVTA